MTRHGFRVTLAALFIFLLLFSLVPGIAQADIGRNGGTTHVKSDMEMMSGVPVHGGGHITWIVSGEAARELRNKIIEKYDGHINLTGTPNGRLDLPEVELYQIHLERYLEDEEHVYMGANLRRFALLNRNPSKDISGLIDTTEASTGKIEIRFYFDAWMPEGSGATDVLLTDTTIPDAIYYPLGETFHGTYKIEHTNYMVSVGDFATEKVSKGTYYLIRTPFGDIFHYSVTFKADSNPNEKLKYEPFSWIECPLVLFIMVVVIGYFVVTMPGRFRRYDVMKNVKLHTLSKILLLLMILLYLFAGIGGFFVAGMYLWIISIVFLFVILVISKTIYENAARVTRMPEKPEPTPAGAAAAGEAAGSELEKEKEEKTVQCATCGEIYNLMDRYSLSSAPCPACGSIGAVEFGREELPPPPPPEPLPPPVPPEIAEPEEIEGPEEAAEPEEMEEPKEPKKLKKSKKK
ncbi:MAG: hypothetical protein JSW00_16140 [Thermoplasmata archaeon]|nr:MAG: hypothetical protein JSW00_16140 [Thermoplasmata archaeon]